MNKNNYYSQKLSAERLQLCYEIAPHRVKQYLKTEIEFVLSKVNRTDLVLESGCGYGRVLIKLMEKAKTVVGIDTSLESLRLAQKKLVSGRPSSCYLSVMNAVELGFSDRLFDMVICIQNAISAFKVNQRKLIKEAIRVTRIGGTVLLSSYSENFWEDRLQWFQLQADYGLIGEIDYNQTGDGVIVCHDGFSATTISPDEFVALTSGLDVKPRISEVDSSSVFYEMDVG